MHEFRIDIDTSALTALSDAYALTPKQFEQAFEKAAKRTAGTFRRLVSREKLGIADLRRTTAIRRRIRTLFRRSDTTRDGIWFGLNDLWASEYRSRPRVVNNGIQFRGRFYPKAFRVPTGRGHYRIYRRENGVLREITIPIEDTGIRYLEREVLPELPDAFLQHFEAEARRRDMIARAGGRVRYR